MNSWVLYKGHKFVDWFYWDLNSPFNDGDKINAYYYDNWGFQSYCEIDITNDNLTNICNKFKLNPYSPVKDSAVYSGGMGCDDTLYLGKLMKPSLSKYNQIRGNHFIGIQGDNLNDIGIQQEFVNFLKEGDYKLSFNFAIHTKYQDSKIKFYLSKKKNQQGKKIFTLKVFQDKFYYHKDNTITFDLTSGEWVYHEKIINLKNSNKYKWLVITTEACGPASFSPNSQYLFLDFIKFEPINCSVENITIEDEILYDESYHAKNYLNIKNTIIKQNAEVYVKAGSLIEIEGNFVTEDSVTFYAEIIPCYEYNRIGGNISMSESQPLELIDKQSFNVYPNPSSGIFTIESEEAINPQQIEVYDVFGKQVQPIINQNGTGATINLENNSKGIYLVRIGIFKQKIILE